MSGKPKIVHVIDSLVRGGAETLLVNLLPKLSERYDIVLVTLRPESDFPRESIAAAELHCLGYSGTASLLSCAWKLRRIIRRHQPALVRSQLFMASLVARIATPRRTPLVFSIHNPMSEDSYSRNRLALPLEKITYRKRHTLIAVSKNALEDFDRWVGIKGKAFVLHNFINSAYFEAPRVRDAVSPAPRLVAVGMLKEQKNYFYLVEAFKALKGSGVSLDIYGEGALRDPLQRAIDADSLPIVLKGKRPDIHNVLGSYDLYVMPSRYEGFGIAPVEAMATGLPLLLSDLPVLHEITLDNALFFDPGSPESFVELVGRIRTGKEQVAELSRRGIEVAREHYAADDYVRRLIAIYDEAIASAE